MMIEIFFRMQPAFGGENQAESICYHFFLTEETVLQRFKGVRLSPYATAIPFLLGRRYHLTLVSVCASQNSFISHM